MTQERIIYNYLRKFRASRRLSVFDTTVFSVQP